MKTIIKTLTTIALISTIQCGWGTVTITRWNNLLSSTYTTVSGTTYTLKDSYSIYEFYMSASQPLNQNIKLSIPENVEVRNVSHSNMYVSSALEIENNGSITNQGSSDNIQPHIATSAANSSITFSGSGAITNDTYGCIFTKARNSSITFSGSGAITNNYYIITNAADSDITFSGSGDITNNENGFVCTNAEDSSITFSGSGAITNDTNGYIGTYAPNSSITFSGRGDITNNSSGNIYTRAENSGIIFSGGGKVDNMGVIDTYIANSSIIFSGGDADTPQMVTTSAEKDEDGNPVKDDEGNIIYGQIYFGTANSSMTIGQHSILSFGKYGKFYAKESNGNVTLDGTIEITSRYASIDVSKMNISSSDSESPGTIDMSKIQECSNNVNLQRPLNLCEDSENNIPATFTCGQSQQLPDIKLPFNCKFNSIDLSNAAKVYYTVLKKGNTAKIEDKTIMLGDQVTDEDVTETYGDYATQSLGVTLPEKSKRTVTTQYAKLMSLSYVANNENTYNISGGEYKLQTNDLTDATDRIASGATRTYNFGFIGETAISITSKEGAENTKAVFMGDNSGYAVAPTISVSEVEFGNKSLFQFPKTYVKGTFTAGNFTNTIPAGAEVKFTSGFTLGKGHTLIVSGTLIG